jgi:hypothetical protein
MDATPDTEELKSEARLDSCPHAEPFVYCVKCKADPCPVGLGKEISHDQAVS